MEKQWTITDYTVMNNIHDREVDDSWLDSINRTGIKELRLYRNNQGLLLEVDYYHRKSTVRHRLIYGVWDSGTKFR